MPSQLIFNQGKTLSKIINDILPSIEEVRILVAYFYFSGFEEIYKKIGEQKVRLLVGLDIERGLSGKIKEIQVIQDREDDHISRKTIREKCY